MIYLLDTNILSEPTRKLPNQQVLQQLAKFRHLSATASVAWSELQYGVQRLPRSKRRELIEQYFKGLKTIGFPILPYTDEAAEWHASERVRLETIGQTPAFVDGMIAAIAQVHGLVLVTRNSNDFRNFSGLQIENWFGD